MLDEVLLIFSEKAAEKDITITKKADRKAAGRWATLIGSAKL
ncbi:hypothetical protein QS257_07550 [Terrilactibacillus sp. S3-3]|nr:hypothetical protein QS257_07550 [Terrilactibacillus sp. S3-3]